MKLLFRYLAPLRGKIATALSVKIVATMGELLIPFLLSYILDTVIETRNMTRIFAVGGIMIACAIAVCLFHILSNFIVAKISRDVSENVRRDLFAKILYLSAQDTDRFTIPSLESRVTTDTYNLHNFVRMTQRIGARAPLLLVGGLIISFAMDAYLSLTLLATMPLIFFVVYTISKRGVPLYKRVQQSVDSMIRVVREDTQGIRVIKALSKNDYENRRYDAVNRTLSADERHVGHIVSATNPLMTLLMNLGITAVVALSATRVANGSSSPATVIAFMQYFTLISGAMMSMSRMFVAYTKCAASAQRISEVLETPDTFVVTDAASHTPSDAHVEFRNVSFSYFGKKNDLHDISFSVPHGGNLGIIGATGSGKTTLIRLLMRTYDCDSGEILIDGAPLTSYTREHLASIFGVSLQNIFLYADSVEENIDFGRNLPHEDIVRAATIAQAHDFISTLPTGYAHKLTPKGTNLSGGQRQRLQIARAIAGRPPILILDDSSSALDYKTDAALRHALKTELDGTTVITVAQRVSSIKHCDLILVLDNGRIIGHGTHEDLLETCKEYREISDSQMGGAFVD